jgi:hypothetical protein
MIETSPPVPDAESGADDARRRRIEGDIGVGGGRGDDSDERQRRRWI